jgi:hypothetical protein
VAPCFLGPLDLRQIGPRRWMTLDDLVFRSARYAGYFVVPRGFQTDLASIPAALWGPLLPPVGAHDRAAVLHDAAYAHALLTHRGARIRCAKHVADDLFAEALRADGVPVWRRVLMVAAVRKFGDMDAHPLQEMSRG